jgi:hypothetical protein
VTLLFFSQDLGLFYQLPTNSCHTLQFQISTTLCNQFRMSNDSIDVSIKDVTASAHEGVSENGHNQNYHFANMILPIRAWDTFNESDQTLNYKRVND